LSDPLVRLMGPFNQECRYIDRVLVEGTRTDPFKLFTVDLNEQLAEVQGARTLKGVTRAKTKRLSFDSVESIFDDFFANDPDVSIMRRVLPDSFLASFQKAVLNYEEGEWATAAALLEDISEGDGPSSTLLRFIKRCHYQAPEGWPGYRVLVKKPGYHENYCI